MNSKKKSRNKVVLSFLLLLVINSTAHAKKFTNEKLIIAINQEWDVLNPITYQTAATESFVHFLFRDMVFRDVDGVVKSDLAEEIPTLKNKLVKKMSVNGVKKVQATWKIKTGAKWSDGYPVTCLDWQFAWQVGSSDFVSKMEQTFYTKIEKIEFTPQKPQECIVTYKNDEWTFDRDLPPLMPAHLEKTIFEKNNNKPSQYEQASLYVTQPTLKGLYNGPYVVSEVKLGSHIIFSPNPYFYGDKPKIQKIIIKFVANSNSLKPYLMSGEIDAISSVGFTPDQAIQFSQEKELVDYTVHFKKAPLYQALMFNMGEYPVSELAVRQALAKAINKKTITEVFLGGKLNPAETLFSEGDVNFVKRETSYNVIAANDILDKAGWIKNDQGIRYKNNKPLEILFKTSAGLKFLESLQLVICEDLKKIGALCKNKNEPPRTLLGDTIQRGQFQMSMFGQSLYPDSSWKGQFHSSEIPNDKNNWAGGNILRVNDKEIDNWLVQVDKEWNKDKRNSLLKKIENKLYNLAVIVPLYHRREAFLAPTTLQGLRSSLKGTAMVYPEYWYFN